MQDKKEFIRWFLKTNTMKRRECVWILNYLISHETMLDKVHFVEEAHYCPRAMIMSATTSSGIPFRFYKGSIMTADAEKSFHDLRLNPDEELFIQLNFPSTPVSPQYMAVLEENSYMPKYLHVTEKDKEMVEQVLEQAIGSFTRNQMEAAIDAALDAGDQERFMQLTAQLKGRTTVTH